LKNNGKYITVTNLVENISKNYSIPASTLRWNIKKLRDFEFIECGDENNRGIPAKITEMGLSILSIIQRGDENE
jgi:predicted transcriptional regulator